MRPVFSEMYCGYRINVFNAQCGDRKGYVFNINWLRLKPGIRLYENHQSAITAAKGIIDDHLRRIDQSQLD